MGREIKRVALDFNWPLEKIWSGYQNEPEIEPPAGDGWQLWETVSEGSPISPVFKTETEFSDYLIEQGYHPQAVHKFLVTGWAPSGAIIGGRFLSDIDCLYTPKDED